MMTINMLFVIYFVATLWTQLLPPTKGEVNAFARIRLFVCLYVCVQDYSKTRTWTWMKCCVSTDVGTSTN